MVRLLIDRTVDLESCQIVENLLLSINQAKHFSRLRPTVKTLFVL